MTQWNNISTTNPNGTTTTGYSPNEKILIGSVMTFSSFIIVFGNILVIFVYTRTKRLRTTQNLFIISLATADVIIGSVSVNMYSLYLLHDEIWPLGRVLCVAWLVIDHWACTASTLTILSIAVDRYGAIVRPMIHRVKHTKSNVKFSIYLVWTLSLFVWCAAIIPYSGHVMTATNQCVVPFHQSNWIVTSLTAIYAYFGPVIGANILYLIIVREVLRLKRSIPTIKRQLAVEVPPAAQNTKDDYTTMHSEAHVNQAFASSLDNCSVVSGRGRLSPAKTTKQHRSMTVSTCSSAEYLPNNVETTKDGGRRKQQKFYPNKKNKSVNMPPLRKHSTLRVSDCDEKEGASCDCCGLFPGEDKHGRHYGKGVQFLCLVILSVTFPWMPYYTLTTVKSVLCWDNIPPSLWKFCYIVGWVNSLLNPLCYSFRNSRFKNGLRKLVCCRPQHYNSKANSKSIQDSSFKQNPRSVTF